MNTNSLKVITKVIQGLLIIQLIYFILSSLIFIAAEHIYPSDEFVYFANTIDNIYGIAYFSSLICSAFWVYNAHKCTEIRGAKNLKYSHSSCVWWYFVPFANIVMPYLTMKETYKASKSPLNWQNEKSSGLVISWWLSFNISLISGGIAKNSYDTTVLLFDVSISLVCTILYFILVSRISAFQK